MARLDYFLVWNHGLKFKYEIFSIIRDSFPILSIHRRDVGDIAKFVRRLYECDTVPFRHLLLKTRYLLKLKPTVGFVLVKNEQPDEQMVGSGAFRHLQCMKMNGVKSEIRGRFNYKEEHVVHTSDYQSQTDHALKLLRINKPRRNGRGVMRSAEVGDLLAFILGVGLVPVDQTPHYAYVVGKTFPYRAYYEKHWGVKLVDDHAPEAFDRLIGNFKYEKPIRVKGNRIIDGVHRAAILAQRGEKYVRVEDVGV
jgi:hypothetical protein